MDNENFELLTLHGSWPESVIDSASANLLWKAACIICKGESGHQEHPFIALVTPGTTSSEECMNAFRILW